MNPVVEKELIAQLMSLNVILLALVPDERRDETLTALLEIQKLTE